MDQNLFLNLCVIGIACIACIACFIVWPWLGASTVGGDSQKRPDIGGQLTDLESWLLENDLMDIKLVLKSSGVKTLEDCLRLDIDSLHIPVDSQTRSKFQSAVSKNSLTAWLKKLGMLDYLPLLANRGHSTLHSLCGVNSKQVSKLFSQAGQRKAFKMALEALNSGWCAEQNAWTIRGVPFYLVLFILVIAVIYGIVMCCWKELDNKMKDCPAGVVLAVLPILLVVIIVLLILTGNKKR